MASIEDLQQRIKVLEEELDKERQKNRPVVREKISQMSSEVVDSNPYRYQFLNHVCRNISME